MRNGNTDMTRVQLALLDDFGDLRSRKRPNGNGIPSATNRTRFSDVLLSAELPPTNPQKYPSEPALGILDQM